MQLNNLTEEEKRVVFGKTTELSHMYKESS